MPAPKTRTTPAKKTSVRQQDADRRRKAQLRQNSIVKAAGEEGRLLQPNEVPIVVYPTDRVLPYFSFVVYGNPVPQGSHKIRYRHGKPQTQHANDGLEIWRDSVRSVVMKALRNWEQVHGVQWVALKEPVFVTATITLPSTAAAEKRGDIYVMDDPDTDKLIRAIGDSISAMPLNAKDYAGVTGEAMKKKVAEQLKAKRYRNSLLQEDSGVMWGPCVKVYPEKAPAALKHPGVIVQMWRMQDLDNARLRPVITAAGVDYIRLDDLRRWTSPVEGTWADAIRGVLASGVSEVPERIEICDRKVDARNAAGLALAFLERGPDEWMSVSLVDC